MENENDPLKMEGDCETEELIVSSTKQNRSTEGCSKPPPTAMFMQ